MRKINFTKKVLFTGLGVVLWVSLVVSVRAFTIDTGVPNAIAYLKKIVLMDSAGTTTWVILDGSGWKIQANSFCTVAWLDCKTATQLLTWETDPVFLVYSWNYVLLTQTGNWNSSHNKLNTSSWNWDTAYISSNSLNNASGVWNTTTTIVNNSSWGRNSAYNRVFNNWTWLLSNTWRVRSWNNISYTGWNIWIWTSTPDTKLDVNGLLKLWTDGSSSCSVTGTIKFSWDSFYACTWASIPRAKLQLN